MRLLVLGSILMFAVLNTAVAADIDGKWKATGEGPMGTIEQNYTFKVDAGKVSGTMSDPMLGDQKISDGSLKGDDLVFTVAASGPMGDMKLEFKGKVSGDEIKLSMSFGDMGSMDLTAKRVK
jgi:hypothetical protein